MNIPIIRLEVEGMRKIICAALSEHAAQMDSDIKTAIDDYCTPENLGVIVRNTARAHLKNAIEEEVRAFFKYGDGRKAVAQAVKDCILKKETYTILDEVG